MPPRPSLRAFITLAFVFALVVPAHQARAVDGAANTQIVFVGAAPEQGLPEAEAPPVPIIAIDGLPEASALRSEVFGARLRARPVSTFVATPSDEARPLDQLFLVAEATLASASTGFTLAVGDERLPMADFVTRLGAAVDAFAPRHRRIGFVHISDADDQFPTALADLHAAMSGLNFQMIVLMVSGEPIASCQNAQPLHYSMVNGLADRAPFGDGNGVSSIDEAERYLSGVLTRAHERGCGPAYSLILKADDDGNADVATHSSAPITASAERHLYQETFEAKFLLQTEAVEPMQAFLADCVYCPHEAGLKARVQAKRDLARAAALEADIWRQIEADADRQRLIIYLENCTLCEYRDEAEALVAEIDEKLAAVEAERDQFFAARDSRDLAALRQYFETCIACEYLEQSEALIASVEQDSAYQAERALMVEGIASKNTDTLQKYLRDCAICDGEEEVRAKIALISKLTELRNPCLDLAGLPQHGGPRKLEEIDQTQARAVCQAAFKEFPDDGLLQTTLGRIAQAAGDLETALDAYNFGMERDVPAAFGLAAYSYFSPADGSAPDMAKVDALATAGAEKGDWLSHEILTVVYSKGLVDGKTGEDAFDAAMTVAQDGNALAQFFVGYYYLTGTGTDASDTLAEEWLKKSVDQGYTHAYSFLAELHERGSESREPNPDRAADLYWSALQQGDPTATDRLTTQLADRDREVVRLIQQRLREAGLYRGPVDGVPGRGTANAIREYADRITGQG